MLNFDKSIFLSILFSHVRTSYRSFFLSQIDKENQSNFKFSGTCQHFLFIVAQKPVTQPQKVRVRKIKILAKILFMLFGDINPKPTKSQKNYRPFFRFKLCFSRHLVMLNRLKKTRYVIFLDFVGFGLRLAIVNFFTCFQSGSS